MEVLLPWIILARIFNAVIDYYQMTWLSISHHIILMNGYVFLLLLENIDQIEGDVREKWLLSQT